MSFNISRFKSELNSVGGPARPSLFELIVSPIGGGIQDLDSDVSLNPRSFSFFCTTVTVPGISFDTVEDTKIGMLNKTIPLKVRKEPLSTVFMVDSDHKILNFLHQWSQKVINHGNAGGIIGNDQMPYELGYKTDYATRLVVRHYSTEGLEDKYYEIILDNAFPTIIGELSLSWETSNSYLTIPVSFVYDKIQFSGAKTGSSTTALSRVNGLLDTLGAVAGFASVVKQTIDQGVKFNSIQDAINRITRVRNSFDNLSDKL